MPKYVFITYVYITIATTAPIVPPIHPSIDFLGLILLNLCFPIAFPVKYAKISVPHAANITYHINMFPFFIPFISATKIVKNTIYAIPKNVYAISLKLVFHLLPNIRLPYHQFLQHHQL